MFITPRRLSRAVLFILLTALVFSGAVFITHRYGSGFKPGHCLEIRDASSNRLYGKWPLEKNGEFAIEFIHSVHQNPVRENFKFDEGMIQAAAVRFSSFGAGMLSDVGEGKKLSRDGDALVITGFDTSFRELSYIVGTVSDHLLLINGETVSLRVLCGRNAHVVLRVK